MLTLKTGVPPGSRAELECALRGALDAFHAPNLRVETAGEFPALTKLFIDLSGGAVPEALPPRPAVDGARSEFDVESLELLAEGITFQGSRATVRLEASGVRLALAGASPGEDAAATLDLAGARTGELAIEMSQREIEKAILALAQSAAREHGVSIERTALKTESTGPRSVKFCADVLARKLFMHTAITLRGELSVDGNLDARLTGLTCSGGGIIGQLASNFLQPHIAKLERQVFPLASFALRGVRVRDIALEAGEPLRVRAAFGTGGHA